jgi:hypothetical protein
MGLSKKPTSGYVSDWQTPQTQTQQQYFQSATETKQNNYITPSSSGTGLTGTSQIVELDINSAGDFSYTSKCVYCGYDFTEHMGKIYLCRECKAPYHESCINMQINEGTCKNCGKILLW